ncbi:MAG: hypothetical protein SGJ27_12240 [Candidatus Melainabacteria bacterium]|nr:hypothetical protein [Candidatus Melainabacteria bacterium]
MKLPNNLLDGISGKKNNGVAIFAVVLMALAGMGGLFWGMCAKFAPETIKGLTLPDANVPPPDRLTRSEPCPACGMG